MQETLNRFKTNFYHEAQLKHAPRKSKAEITYDVQHTKTSHFVRGGFTFLSLLFMNHKKMSDTNEG